MRIVDGWKPIYITLGIIVILIACLAPLGHDVVKPMTKDGGLIQVATVSLLCISLALALLQLILNEQPVLKWIEASCILSVYTMREMDFHRIFTAEHVTRIKLYTGPFPLGEKLVGGTIMLLFIAVTLHFFITNIPLLIHGLKRKVPRAWYLIAWALLLIGAQIIDKLHLFKGFIKPLTEETLELGAAMMMIFIVISFSLNTWRLMRRKKQ
jgi:hypothetical protein